MPAPVQSRWFWPAIQIETLITGRVQLLHHRHQACMRHAVRRCTTKQNRCAVSMLHLIRRQIQVERTYFAAKPCSDPAGQQIDGDDHAIAAITVKNNSAWSNRYHASIL